MLALQYQLAPYSLLIYWHQFASCNQDTDGELYVSASCEDALHKASFVAIDFASCLDTVTLLKDSSTVVLNLTDARQNVHLDQQLALSACYCQ